MLEMDKLHLEYPYFGARRLLVHLPDAYKGLNINRIRRLMRLMGIHTIHNAQYVYYAAHCDYLVSADEGLLLKAKVLCKLFGIDTKVLNIQEFADQIGSIAGLNYTAPVEYIEFLKCDLNEELVIGTKPLFKHNGTQIIIRINQNHFSYFNEYFDGDTGRGVGASHQTGWTGLIAELLFN